MRSINFLSILVLSLAFALGCGGSGDSGDPSNPGGGSGGDGGSTGNGGNGTETYKASIHVKAPNDLIGSFYRAEPGKCKVTAEKADSPDANCVVVCPGVNECSFDIDSKSDFDLVFVTARHLFVPKLISGIANNATKEVVWDEPGTWGLAPPKGWYMNQETNTESEVETKLTQGHIVLYVDSVVSLITGSDFGNDSCDGLNISGCTSQLGTWEGNISDDLTKIKLNRTREDGTSYEKDLVRMD